MKKSHNAQHTNVVWHHATVTRARREQLNKHRSICLWFTGLSGAGKSTLAHAIEERLHRTGCRTIVLDGDNVRHGLCSNLGFSIEDRAENIRRIGEMSRLFVEAGVIALTAFISPFRSERRRARELLGEGNFIEIYCDCPINVCEQRDVKACISGRGPARSRISPASHPPMKSRSIPRSASIPQPCPWTSAWNK